ncbi:MAG: lactoylglutathione lyase [Gammaproteobacteria bacterium]|nr:lactoylglutathione lyase [Gammaproteobacteria bacterium]
MKYLHTMVRVHDLDASLGFYRDLLGLIETDRYESEQGQFTLVYLAAAKDLDQARAERAPLLELTYNWDGEVYQGGRNFGHLAFEVDDVYVICQKALDAGIAINVPPRDGHMAFFRSPDNISIELLQKGEALAPAEPWISMPTSGEW